MEKFCKKLILDIWIDSEYIPGYSLWLPLVSSKFEKLQDFLLLTDRLTLLFGFFRTLTEQFFEC